jgi:predicted metal-binding membrane protein
MNSLLNSLNRPSAAELQYFFWRHPEWWSWALCGSAWAVMLVHGWQHAGHELAHWMTFGQELAFWMLMAAAMMLPLVIHQVWVTAAGSLWPRRHRAIAGFLAGYFAPWLGLGFVAAGLRFGSLAHTTSAAAAGFVVAGLWQLTPMHRRALVACHRTLPLAPVGWRADLDCLRFGGAIGVACVASCWPLMLACAITGHSLVAMAGGMAVGALERWSSRPNTGTILAATLVLASYYLALAVLN